MEVLNQILKNKQMKKAIIALSVIVLLQACTSSEPIPSIKDSVSVIGDSVIIKKDTVKVVDYSSIKIIK